MLQAQTRKPTRTFNHHGNFRTDTSTPNSMMTRVLYAVIQALSSQGGLEFDARLGDAAPGRVAVTGLIHCLKLGLSPAAKAEIETLAALSP